ncbi:Gmad2 immunoglobulin-like domain-containing protein [Conyzicola nivalis]|nr:Gmad2 immunoglobulin-like domain-containing protein [Conyzicola nivalis]
MCAATVVAVVACAPGGGTPPTPGPTPSPSGSSPGPTASPTGDPRIRILTPTRDTTVLTPVALTGTANTFEAQLVVDAQNKTGDTLCVREVTASSGSGTEGAWQAVLGVVPQGDTEESIVLRAFERSAADGSIVNLVELPVTLSADRPDIVVTSPVCGDTVSAGGPLLIEGRATVFEAALTVELRDAAGTVVFSRNLMTGEGGVDSPFSELLTLPAGVAPGFYDLVAFNISAKDGAFENEFPVQLLIE